MREGSDEGRKEKWRGGVRGRRRVREEEGDERRGEEREVKRGGMLNA